MFLLKVTAKTHFLFAVLNVILLYIAIKHAFADTFGVQIDELLDDEVKFMLICSNFALRKQISKIFELYGTECPQMLTQKLLIKVFQKVQNIGSKFIKQQYPLRIIFKFMLSNNILLEYQIF